jgi:mRNA interferase MazF
MGKFVKGDIVVIPFPYSDLTESKRRPALIVSEITGDDIILCQITSQSSPKDHFVIPIAEFSFENGKLPVASFIRPNRIFTTDNNLILKKMVHIKKDIYQNVVETIISIISK